MIFRNYLDVLDSLCEFCFFRCSSIDKKVAPKPNSSRFGYSGQDLQDTTTNLLDDSKMSYVAYPNSSTGQKKTTYDHILSDDMNSFVKKDGSHITKPITTSSVDDLKRIVREAEMEIYCPQKFANSESIMKKVITTVKIRCFDVIL